MADIRQIEDLVRYGRLHGDTLVLEPDVKLVFFNDLKIPYTLKISGNTSFKGSGDQPTIDFATGRPSICCSSTAEHFTIASLDVKSASGVELFKFRRNFVRNITFLNTEFDVTNFGELSTRSLSVVHSGFKNKEQSPIILDPMNTLTICDVVHSSKYPLFDLTKSKAIRDNITVHGMTMENEGGLMIIGEQDEEGMLDLSVIPKLGITVNDIDMPIHNLLKIKQADGGIVTLPKELVKQYFL